MRLFLLLLSLLLSVVSATPQERVAGIEYLNERLRIPESELFDEGAYIESGVGLSFGVDKRLTYLGGEYDEAAQRFEMSVRQFRYKAEVWVFLSRAYFYMKAPDRARDALQRAEALMPDLSDKLWQPLTASLLWEIRQRARKQQAQVDFYSTGQDEVLSLFRLYLFLNDQEGARDLITVAYERARMMREGAQMVSGKSRRAQAAEADRWDELATDLTTELQAVGLEAPPAPERKPVSEPPAADIEEDERIRVLQLRVDYYRVKEDDYRDLFQAYLDRGDPLRARRVLASLDRQMADMNVRASVAPTLGEQADIEEEVEQLRTLRQELESMLPDEAATAKP